MNNEVDEFSSRKYRSRLPLVTFSEFACLSVPLLTRYSRTDALPFAIFLFLASKLDQRVSLASDLLARYHWHTFKARIVNLSCSQLQFLGQQKEIS